MLQHISNICHFISTFIFWKWVLSCSVRHFRSLNKLTCFFWKFVWSFPEVLVHTSKKDSETNWKWLVKITPKLIFSVLQLSLLSVLYLWNILSVCSFCIVCFKYVYFPQCIFPFQVSLVNSLLKVSLFPFYMCMW